MSQHCSACGTLLLIRCIINISVRYFWHLRTLIDSAHRDLQIGAKGVKNGFELRKIRPSEVVVAKKTNNNILITTEKYQALKTFWQNVAVTFAKRIRFWLGNNGFEALDGANRSTTSDLSNKIKRTPKKSIKYSILEFHTCRVDAYIESSTSV